MSLGRPDAPYKREYDNGRSVWVARFTNPATGKREYARPTWNRGKSTFDLRRDAQRAIKEAIDGALAPTVRTDTVGGYVERWPERHPRSERTNRTNAHRLSRLLDVEVEGRALREWPLAELRKRHANELLDHMLRVEGRALRGARGILSVYSAMFEDAIDDDLAEVNPFHRVKIRANDPRIRKAAAEPRVWTFEEMHAFARSVRTQPQAMEREAMVRVLSDCGLRLGEMLALRRRGFDGEALHVQGTADEGRILEVDGPTKTHDRTVPVPPSLAHGLSVVVEHAETELLFPTQTGKVWRKDNFYRDVWRPAREATGLDIRPHDMRHSWVSLLQAEGIDLADLARVAGHKLETMIGTYTHPLERSHEKIREVIG